MTKAIEEVYSALKGQFRGDLIRPGDDEYETARGIWNAMVAQRPGLIARCADVPEHSVCRQCCLDNRCSPGRTLRWT
jgi:hypothetical protein